MAYAKVIEDKFETVVSEYKKLDLDISKYQTEEQLEDWLLESLKEQGYEYRTFNSHQELIANLRLRLEQLNKTTFSDDEWNRLFVTTLGNPSKTIVDKTRLVQKERIVRLKRDDGTSANVRLIDDQNVNNNYLQVIHQVKTKGSHDNRYDVTILVNGFPMVQIELKKRGVELKEAYNQIERYGNESFWAESGLYEYIQVFVISNGSQTKYYSNTLRYNKTKDGSKGKNNLKSGSFELTNYWADAKNNTIYRLEDFSKTFLDKRTLLNILTRYCIFTVNDELLVMRPYQIAATEKIINKVLIAENNNLYGTVNAGGYVWHTTGSGKTVTSYKAASLISTDTTLSFIEKVIFVVDRQDLDYQTMKEYNRLEKDCVSATKNTSVLENQMSDPTKKILVTTIQKLSIFCKKYKTNPIFNKKVVFVFDECHRSQFGDMHKLIEKSFKKYAMFGFTGTPIFQENAKNKLSFTTEQLFGNRLHTYTVVNAIKDKTVLPFKVEYINTIKKKEMIKDEKVYDIDTKKAYSSSERIEGVVSYVFENYNRFTKRNAKEYHFNTEDSEGKRQKRLLAGFNALFACEDIPMAKLYYSEFKKQNEQLDDLRKLKIATIYSFAVNEDLEDETIEENSDSVEGLDASSKEFLNEAIKDYNLMFGTNFSVDGDSFRNYYKDVSLRVKNKELDLLIVVNMFLTGFDSKTTNTLFVDKNLKYHTLIQAFSRTNRILNSIKDCGNIVCFRNLKENTDKAISLFGDKDAAGFILLKDYESYYNGYTDKEGNETPGYKKIVQTLKTKYRKVLEGEQIYDRDEQNDFVKTFSAYLRVKNILTLFDKFQGNQILMEQGYEQEFQSEYLRIRDERRGEAEGTKVNINNDIVFETELIESNRIDISYIINEVSKRKKEHQENREISAAVKSSITSDPELRSKKALIDAFIEQVELKDGENPEEAWDDFIKRKQREDIERIILEERLKHDETISFMDDCLKRKELKLVGNEFLSLLPAASLFNGGSREKSRKSVQKKFTEHFEIYCDLY